MAVLAVDGDAGQRLAIGHVGVARLRKWSEVSMMWILYYALGLRPLGNDPT